MYYRVIIPDGSSLQRGPLPSQESAPKGETVLSGGLSCLIDMIQFFSLANMLALCLLIRALDLPLPPQSLAGGGHSGGHP